MNKFIILSILALFLVSCGPEKITEYKFIYPDIPRVVCEDFKPLKNPKDKDYKDSDSAEMILNLYEIYKICHSTKIEQDKFLDKLKTEKLN